MKHFAWIVVGSLALAGVLWAGGTVRENWQTSRDVSAAISLVDRGAYEEAWALLQSPRLRRSSRLELELARGVCARELGRSQEAFDAWRLLDSKSAAGKRAAAYRVSLARQTGRYSEALGVRAEDLPEEGDVAARAMEDYLFLLRIQGRDTEARRIMTRRLGRSSDVLADLRALWSQGHDAYPIHAARRALDQAASTAAGDVGVRLGWVHSALREDRLDEAERQLEACVMKPESARAIALTGLQVGLARGDVERVAESVQRLRGQDLELVEWLRLQAWAGERLGDTALEEKALAAWLELESAQPRALERLAQLRDRQGAADGARALRARKATRDQAERTYERLVNSEDAAKSVPELARLAEVLGLREEASACYRLILRDSPGDGDARAALTRLGGQPSGARADRGEIREELLARLSAAHGVGMASNAAGREVRVPRYTDEAASSGLGFTFENGDTPEHQMPETMSGGVGVFDLDNDGLLDVYAAQGGRFPPLPGAPIGDRIFRNLGAGQFADVSSACGLLAMPGGYTHGVCVGDVNNDGHDDLFITRWRQYALYLNKGGHLEDATQAWGLGGAQGWPTSAAFADLDGDGDLDLYVCHYVIWDEKNPVLCKGPAGKPTFCSPAGFPAEADHLFRNDGDRFTDVSEAAGIRAGDRDGRGLGVIAADLDEDGRVDLFVANDTTANLLFRNLGDLRFEERALAAGVAANAEGGLLAGMGVAHGDLDGDGLPDLGVTNYYGECTTFYKNFGMGQFSDLTAAIGLGGPTRYRLGFGLTFADMNNDQFVDVVQANGHVEDFERAFPYAMPAQLLLGNGEGRLRDVTEQAGPPWQVARFGRGLAVADLDNDGRLEALLVDLRGPMSWIKPSPEAGGDGVGRYLSLELVGTVSNRDAVGARVEVEVGSRRLVQHRFGGGSYLSAGDSRLHFGMGEAERVERVTVAWPSGKESRFEGVATSARYRVVEGKDALERVDAP